MNKTHSEDYYISIRIENKNNNFDEIVFTHQNIEQLFPTVNANSNMFVEIYRMNDEYFPIFKELLQQIKSLRRLKLTNCSFNEKNFFILLQMLKKEVLLEVILSSSNPIWPSVNIISNCLKLCPREIKLILTYDDFNEEAITKLAHLSMHYGCIKSLIIECNSDFTIYKYLPMFLSDNTILENLAVSNGELHGLNTVESNALFKVLEKNTTLKTLDIYQEYWDKEMCKSIKESLGRNSTLYTLTLNAGQEANNLIDLISVVMDHSSLKIVVLMGDIDNDVLKIAEIIKNNKNLESIRFVTWFRNISNEINVAKIFLDAVRENKILTDFKIYDQDGSFYLDQDKKSELISYLNRNKEIKEKYLQATEFYKLAFRQGESPNLAVTEQTTVNHNYENSLQFARECLAAGYPKAQLFIDSCLLSYSRFFVRISKYSKAMACLNSITPTSEIFKEVQFEKANFILASKDDNESEQDKQIRMRRALAVIPDLYQEDTPSSFKQIFLQLMQLYSKESLTIYSGLTWAQVEDLNRAVFFKVALDIEIFKVPENQDILDSAKKMIEELTIKKNLLKAKLSQSIKKRKSFFFEPNENKQQKTNNDSSSNSYDVLASKIKLS